MRQPFFVAEVHIFQINLVSNKKKHTFAVPNHNGTMAEWLGSGLQNRVQQFDSAWYLKGTTTKVVVLFFIFINFTPD